MHVVTSGAGAPVRAELLRASDRVDVAWRNGGGTTTVVATSDSGRDADAAADGDPHIDPDWRVSIATIAEAGAFSTFPGVDRVLMPLSPAGLTLEIGGRIRPLSQYETVSFTGEDAVAAVEVASIGDDLNLMTRRGACGGSIEVRSLDGAERLAAAAGETVLVIVLEGDVSARDVLWGDGPLLTRDAVKLPSGAVAELTGHGTLAVVRVSRRSLE